MSRIALYFASGESLYLGAALLLFGVVAPFALKRASIFRIRNVVAWIGLIFVVMACPPFAPVVDVIFIAVFMLWLITSNKASLSRTFLRLQRVSTLLLAVLVLVLTAIEFSHRRMPRVMGSSDHLVVIGDSISSGIDSRVPVWPLLLQQRCGVEVRNLARPGAQVSEGLFIARSLKDDDHLVLIEMGGNDLLMGVSSDDYGKTLDALLSKVATPNRMVVMFELPLLPNKIAYGQIQRRLSAKYHVSLIPKRYFAQVLGDASATTDGLHLSDSGAQRMALLVAQVLSPPLPSCQFHSNHVVDGS